MRVLRTTLVLLCLGALLTGCAIEDPTAGKNRQSRETPPAAEPLPHSDSDAQSVVSPEPLPATSGQGGGRTPAAAVSDYATAFANWSWRDVADQNGRVLARLAAGSLREAVLDNARALREDTTLRRDRVANRGEILALDVQGSDPSRRTVWVVLRETASTRGRALPSDTRTSVYKAAAERLDDGAWYVTGFEPQG